MTPTGGAVIRTFFESDVTTTVSVIYGFDHQREEVVHHMSDSYSGTLEVVGR